MRINWFIKKVFQYLNILILVIYSGTLYGLREIGLSSIVDRKNLIVYIGFYYSILYLLLYTIKKGGRLIKNNILILLFCTFIIFISIFFNNTSYVLRENFLLIGTILYVMYLVINYEFEKLMRMFYKSQVIVTISNIIFTIIYPQFGKMMYDGELVWRGLFGHKNSLAVNMAFGIILSYSIYSISHKKGDKVFTMLNMKLSFIVLLLTNSLTSLVIVILSYIILQLYKKQCFKINPIKLLLLVNIIIYGFVFLGNKYNDLFMRVFGRDLSLTGRVDIWEVIIDLILKKPLTGYGYGGIWYEDSLLQNYIWSKTFIGMEGSHNGFLEWALQIGIIGMILFIIVLSSMGKKTMRIKKINPILFSISIQYTVYLLIFYITEKITSPITYQFLFLIIIIVATNQELYKAARIKERQ